MITIHISSIYVNTHCHLNGYSVIALVWYVHVPGINSSAKCYVGLNMLKLVKLNVDFKMINTFFHKLRQWSLYSSVHKFIMTYTDENGENWYVHDK